MKDYANKNWTQEESNNNINLSFYFKNNLISSMALSEKMKAKLRETLRFITERNLQEYKAQNNYECCGDTYIISSREYSERDINEASKRAFEELRDNFEEHNSFISESDFPEDSTYQAAKGRIIDFIEGEIL